MVRKKEIIYAGGGFLAALVLIGGGLWWHGHSGNGQQGLAEQAASSDQSSSDDTGSTGGLNVSSGNASDLGQLSSNQSSNKSNGSDSGSGSSGSNGVDPSTFSQYDKYKNEKNALFADVQKGTGAALTAGRKATVYYKGWLTNGALIDQSPVDSKGQPQPYMFTMGAHQVILGWEEAMYDMKAGGTRMLIIPPAAGYGSKGQGAVPPNAVLIFEVQLLKVR